MKMSNPYLSSCDRMLLESFPGMVRYQDSFINGVKPFSNICITEKKTVLLATAAITEDNLFMNGLFQNIYIMYRMFEAMGWIPFLLVNMKPANMDKVPKYMQDVHSNRLLLRDASTTSDVRSCS